MTRPAPSVLACDGVCIAFAVWTVLCHAVVLLSGTPVHLGWAVLACASIAAGAIAFAWRTGRLKAVLSTLYGLAGDTAHHPPAGAPLPDAPGWRTRAFFLVAGCAIAARFYVTGDLRELWLLALAFFAASLLAIARTPRAFAPPSPSRAREAVVWSIGLACAALTLGLHAPDTDDSFYGNVAVSVVDFPHKPLLAFDTLHGIEGAPLKMVAYKAASIELLSGFISALTGLETLQVYHLVMPAIAALLVPLALARLFRLLAGERWLWAVIAVVLLLALDNGGGRGSFSAFAFPRLFQGKAMFVSVGAPLLVAHGIRFGLAPSAGRFALLAAAQIAALGASVTAFWAGPLFAMLGVLVAIAPGRAAWKPLLAGAATSAYVVALGLFIALSNRTASAGQSAGTSAVAASADLDLLPGAYAMVLGEGAHLAASIAVALIAWPLCRTPLARRFAVLAPLLFFAGAGNPHLTRYVALATTSTIFWRVLWLLPIPLLAGLAVSALVGVGQRRSPLALARVPLVGLALAVAASFAVERGALKRYTLERPRPKVDAVALRVARAVVKALPPHSRVAAPEEISRVLPMLNGYSYPLVTKVKYLPRGTSRDREQRLRATLLLGRKKPSSGDRRWLVARLDRFAVDGVVAVEHKDPERGWDRALEDARFRKVSAVEGHGIWVRRR